MVEDSYDSQDHRYILKLTPGAQEQMQLLQQKTEQRNLSLLIQSALSLYDQLADIVLEGGRLYVENSDGVRREVIIRGLSGSDTERSG